MADTWEALPTDALTTTGMLTGMSQVFGMDGAWATDDVEGPLNEGGSDVGGTVPVGTIQDGMRRLSMHNTGHSEAKEGNSTPHSSRLERMAFLTEKR